MVTGVHVPRRLPAPNTTTTPLPHRNASNPPVDRHEFKPTDEELYLTRQILVSRGLDPEAGSLKGEQAREVFNRSALPFPMLRDIWNVADEDGSGDLTRDEIVMALRLIGWVQAGEKLSEALLLKVGPLPTLDGITDVQYTKPRRANSAGSPPIPGAAVGPSSGSSEAPSISLFPAVNQEHVQEFRNLFAEAGPVNGLLGQDKVMRVYMRFDMSFEELRKIINAVARRTVQSLDFSEFACGLYILRALQLSQLHSVPSVIPADIYNHFTELEPSPAHVNTPQIIGHITPPSTVPTYTPTSPPEQELTPNHLMAAVSQQLTAGRQSVPPNFFGHRQTPSLQLPQRVVQTPGPSTTRHSMTVPQPAQASSADSEWDIPIRDRNSYELYFYKLDEPGNGWLDKETFDEFVKVYRIGKEDLDRIWNLTNLTASSQMNLDEFIVALHLVKQCSQGIAPPSVLPLSLIPPSLRRETSTSLSQIRQPELPPLPPSRSRTNSESFGSPSSSPKIGKKPPPIPPKKGGSISYKKPPSPVVPSSSPGGGTPMSPTSDNASFMSSSSSSSVSPNLPPKLYQQSSKPNLKPGLSSTPSVPSISEVDTEIQLQDNGLVSSPFEDPDIKDKSLGDYAEKAHHDHGSRRQSSSSGSGFAPNPNGSSDSTTRSFDHQHRPSFVLSQSQLPSYHESNTFPTSYPMYPTSPQPPQPSPSHEVLEGFKEEISRLGRQVESLLGQLAAQNTIRDTNEALRIENEILKSQVKDTEKMMNEVIASSLQEASRSNANQAESQAAEEIWRLMAEVSSKETRIEDLERRVEGLSREERELRDSLREAEAANGKVKADLAESDRKLTQKEGETEQLKKRLAELERALMDEVVNANGSGNNASGSSSGRGSGRSKSVKATANNNNTDKDDPSVKELKVLIRDVTKENEGLKEELRGMQRSMEQMLMSGSRGMVEEIERENRRLKVHVGELESMVGQLQASVGVGSGAYREEINQMKSQLKDVHRAFSDYRTTSEAKTGESQQKIEQLVAENNRLKMDLHEAVERERRRGGARHGEDDNVPPPAYDDSPFVENPS